jgi:signal transduction histidine kinase
VIEQLIFASDEREFVPFVFQQKGIFGDQKTLIHSTVIPIGGRMWRFEIVPTPTYFVEHRATNVWFIFLGGIVLTILTILVALVSSGRQRRLQKLLDNTDAMNYELRLKSAENESWAAELVISNKDLAIANEELLFQSMETEKRATELTRSYDENAVLIDQMNHMQKLESIGRLTSGIAHDFNNILACMLGFNEMNQDVAEDITDKKLSAELVNNTKQIDDAGKRAVSLIAKMMAYCRQDTKKEKMDVKPTQEVIKEVLTMLRPALTSRIKLDFVDMCRINGSDCDMCGLRNNCNTDIQIDAIDLHQILTNLAVNARDAMKENGGTIAIFLKTTTTAVTHCLACAASLESDFIELSVSDNGTGIEDEIMKRIFDPFFTTKEQGEGTGLGLSAVSGMVHRAGGHILIDSNLTEPNRGTMFRLLFPLVSKN